MMNTASKRAAHGAQMLDLVRPGWHRDIDLSTLDIDDIDNCVLGQLYGDFDWGMAKLGIDEDAAEEYGFDNASPWRSYRPLTRAWRREIRHRKTNIRGPEMLVTWVDEIDHFRAPVGAP